MNIQQRIQGAGCGCKPMGAGFTASEIADMGTVGQTYLGIIADSGLPAEPPVGTRAILVEPYPVDRGWGLEPRMVEVFERKSNGRWLSMPGQEISFSTLAQLRQNAAVAEIELPDSSWIPKAEALDLDVSIPELDVTADIPEQGTTDIDTDPVPQATEQAKPTQGGRMKAWHWIGIAAGAVVVIGGTVAAVATLK